MDVFAAWLPVDEPDLAVGPTLCTDQRVMAVATDHPLAGKPSVSLETFADFPHVMVQIEHDYWEDSYLPFNTDRGRKIERPHLVTTADEMINVVAMGDAVHVFPSHVLSYWGMPHISWLRVDGIQPLNFVLVWRTETENPLIHALAEMVRELGTFAFNPNRLAS